MATTEELREWTKCWPDSAVVAVLNEAADTIDAERALADDLMDVLARMTVGWKPGLIWMTAPLDQHPDVQRVSARYRAARA